MLSRSHIVLALLGCTCMVFTADEVTTIVQAALKGLF